MRVTKEQKEITKKQILGAAENGFRQMGYGGLGVDALAKNAGVTSGAFYGYFKSKDEAFLTVVANGLELYRATILELQSKYKKQWVEKFIDYYLSKEHCVDISNGCAVPGLSSDVLRGDDVLKALYEEKSTAIAEAIAEGLNDRSLDKAWALMSILAGGIIIARSQKNAAHSSSILQGIKSSAMTIAT